MGYTKNYPDPYIKRIKTYDNEPFTTGQVAEFAVWPRNYGEKDARNCKVIISGENINTYTLEAGTLDSGDIIKLPVDIIGYKPGTFKLKFEVVCDGESSKYKADNIEYETYTWVGSDMSHMLNENSGNNSEDDDISFEVVEKSSRNESEEYSQLINDDDDVDGTVNERSDVDWYKIRFKDNGKANFWVRPRHEDLDVDIAVYKAIDGDLDNGLEKAADQYKSTRGDGKDDLVTDIPVGKGEYYYVKIKHYGSIPSGHLGNKYWLRCKLVANNFSSDVVSRDYYVNQGDYPKVKLGTSSKTVSQSGCYICSIAMIICWFLKDDSKSTKDALVNQLALKCTSSGGYSNANIKYNGRTFAIKQNRTKETDSNMPDVKQKLSEGYPYIVQVPGHFVVVSGYDSSKTGWEAFQVLDPGRRAYSNLQQTLNHYNKNYLASKRFIYEI